MLTLCLPIPSSSVLLVLLESLDLLPTLLGPSQPPPEVHVYFCYTMTYTDACTSVYVPIESFCTNIQLDVY